MKMLRRNPPVLHRTVSVKNCNSHICEFNLIQPCLHDSDFLRGVNQLILSAQEHVQADMRDAGD